MQRKEQAIIKLNEVIYSKKSKLSRADREKLIVIREDIRNARNKKGILAVAKKLLKLMGIDLDLGDED